MKEILIVDDDDQLRRSFKKLLTEEGYSVRTASSGEEGVESVREKAPDLLIMDIRLPGMNGLEAFRTIRALDNKLPALIMTAFGTTETAIEATKLGAYDYVLKPFDIPDLLSLIAQAIEAGRLMKHRVKLDNTNNDVSTDMDVIIGKSGSMQQIYKAIGRVAPTDATVLIRGETGTGKELVARALYQHSSRADKPFLVINCVAIPDTLLESELFGYEKGAFTGAHHRHIGKIEQANRGTVFLDEIGDMPNNIQAKLLRLLEDKTIERLGGHDFIPADVRILAATNRDLESAIQQGRFREDLYYRLKVVTINLPPLRERQDDTTQLCDYFMIRFSNEMAIDNPGMTVAAKEKIGRYDWPGNVRELANVIKKTLIFNRGYPVRPDDIDLSPHDQNRMQPRPEQSLDHIVKTLIQQELSDNEKNIFSRLTDKFAAILICEALAITQGNRSKAAQMLGLSRPTLLAKIDKFKLIFQTNVSPDDTSNP